MRKCFVCFGELNRGRLARYCLDCRSRSGQKRASSAVRAAVDSGKIAPATGLMCVDCGKPAHVYDHRDYYRPLNVSPVCYLCNVRRGPAIQLSYGFRVNFPYVIG